MTNLYFILFYLFIYLFLWDEELIEFNDKR